MYVFTCTYRSLSRPSFVFCPSFFPSLTLFISLLPFRSVVAVSIPGVRREEILPDRNPISERNAFRARGDDPLERPSPLHPARRFIPFWFLGEKREREPTRSARKAGQRIESLLFSTRVYILGVTNYADNDAVHEKRSTQIREALSPFFCLSRRFRYLFLILRRGYTGSRLHSPLSRVHSNVRDNVGAGVWLLYFSRYAYEGRREMGSIAASKGASASVSGQVRSPCLFESRTHTGARSRTHRASE